ncbi:ribonuclease Z [Rhodoplanes sp. TEM]|uniref:Ribonuclease Z n=1 Tax=Rhodoplanes tepidamans TaxID=200616 RepID=A0ABT5J489_RHOTP|nr:MULTISPECIES: ribonuclease Z [Rhodoplanes]MDC7784450.1 ribonuclease Z [Rhodoplanes tepidamans]MDC7983480.1 ribonuclease Z [Rhodoplanes sp. TEM]MDQ0356957.1 ribonuclease Z [Rhodoplanes tepidamans]
MSRLAETRPVGGPFDDPGLLVDLRFGRRALLFDLGDLSGLGQRERLRVTDAFVSHAHMDHFRGFDTLLALGLHRPGTLRLVGPKDFADRVAAKIAGYTWNLLDETTPDFSVVVDEFFDGAVRRRTRFPGRRAFAREAADPPALSPGLVHDEDDFSIEAMALDHGIPSLAFALQERRRINVRRDALDRRGLPVGPWLTAAKRAVRRGDPPDTEIATDDGRRLRLGDLLDDVLSVGPGLRVAYVVDAAPHDANVAAATALARGADRLYIESAFATEDLALAQRRLHLTAGIAGRIARAAGVREVIPLHVSPRYLDRPDHVPAQLRAAFAPP